MGMPRINACLFHAAPQDLIRLAKWLGYTSPVLQMKEIIARMARKTHPRMRHLHQSTPEARRR